MAKRGYKLQEFVAHSANVNCLKIGKKTRRNFITGGDDEKVNLWSIGKPTAITSLSGHTSPIESVAFDSTEVLVAAGASSGVIKLWDLEETKVVRTLNGHRSYCTAVEFHPFGEFFASGSMDTNLKIWDIRKKGCIHTYKGHRRAVSTIRFSPDGRWVVSGGLDNVIKIWDLTAGKLLHEFKFHEGHIKSMDFHPLEFLLATGSSDKTVKFWDLETFELIGTTRPEATGVRSITFHPDGRTIFCGLDSSLKVYSWEPIICHDSLDMGWSTLGDLCINDGKLVGCSYYQNSVAVWVADTSLIEQSGPSNLAEENTRMPHKFKLQKDLTERVESPRRSTMSSDDDTKDIKNIYVDTAGMTPVSSKVVNLQNPKEIHNLVTPNPTLPPAAAKITSKPLINEQDNTAASLKPSHRRKPSTTKLDIEGLSITVESGLKSGSDPDAAKVSNLQRRVLSDDAAKDSSEEKTKESQKASSPSNESVDSNKELKSVKYVNGVAVVHGRTRSLVERFEKREKLNTDESQLPDPSARVLTNTDTPAPIMNPTPEPEPKTFTMPGKRPDVTKIPIKVPEAETFTIPEKRPDLTKIPIKASASETFTIPEKRPDVTKMPIKTPEAVTFTMPEKIPHVTKMPIKAPEAETYTMPVVTKMPLKEPEAETFTMPDVTKMPLKAAEAETFNMNDVTKMPLKAPEAENFMMPEKIPDVVSSASNEATKSPTRVQKHDSRPNTRSEDTHVQRPRTAPSMLPEKGKVSPMPRSISSRRLMPEKLRTPSPMVVARRSTASSRVMPERTRISSVLVSPRHDTINNRMIPQKPKSSPLMDDNGPQTTGRGLVSKKDNDDVAEDLMTNHDVFLSSLRSRLTKLQVVRHFWEHNDTKGAIDALRKLPDHAVQADVVNVLMERMDSLTLDLFSCLLPVLLELLDSNTERHISVSLQLLLKLVAVFGPVVSSTISAPPAVGVDLHAEKRLESCNQCHTQLQKIHKCLPSIIKRGGLVARCAQELNIILQKS
ncbi:katanin p80 WD40 repeat-containing subunit B1 homolog KTN80.4 isoform X1 [Lactuca sativa]|uniref:katanin p80 WD40 repeat-containing subunit B1 homolog KTN80.4 isoform X1 n=1 Tax=Lactuca sativa TaxID=4236 RepID=UPI000CD995B4|nr:katanin p80 WD40 repeat-containing subunit B1 homolog KTN80.4 isoform X1 [Lactuca sativa]